MNSTSPHIRATEMSASALESFGGQPHSTETYARARELRRFIAQHPGCRASELPAALRSYTGFLLSRKLITTEGRERRFRVVPM